MEECGEIIIVAPEDVVAHFDTDVIEALKKLAVFAGVNDKVVNAGKGAISDVERNGKLVRLSYDFAEWVDFSMAFVSLASGIEYYSRHADEYGGLCFLALPPSGKRSGVRFDQGGDEMEYEAYRQKARTRLLEWQSNVSDVVKRAFPSFADVNPDDYIY